MAKHYMTKASGGMVSGCGKRSYQFGLSTEFTFSPLLVKGCRKCEEAAKRERVTEVEIEDLPKYTDMVITDHGSENLYFTHNGRQYFCKCF